MGLMETTTTTATATVEAVRNGRFVVSFLVDGRVSETIYGLTRPAACATLVMGGFVGGEASGLVNRAQSLRGTNLLAFGIGTGERA